MSATRLDKYLSLSGERSRSEATKLIRSGQVTVDGKPVCDPSVRVAEGAQVLLRGQPVADSTWQYYLLYKPSGVLTAARDGRAATVMDLLPPALAHRRVLPVGRLDKDTTGLLLLTNDGALAHSLIDPKRHVWKTYIAQVEGRLTAEDEAAFAAGMALSDFTAKPAQMRILQAEDQQSVARVELREGKYHQVKRMFSARGHEVLTLHRSAFGPITLPDDAQPGFYRELTAQEVSALKEAVTHQP